MKLFTTVITLAFSIVIVSSFAQFESAKEVYKSPKIKSEIPKHKAVAILLFGTTIP